MTENSAKINIGEYAAQFDLPQSTKLDALRSQALEAVTSKEIPIERVIEDATYAGLSVEKLGKISLVDFKGVIGSFRADTMLAGFFAAEWVDTDDQPEVLLPYIDTNTSSPATTVFRLKPMDALNTMVTCAELNGIDRENLYLKLKSNSTMLMPKKLDKDTVLASDELSRGVKQLLEKQNTSA